MNLCGAHFGLCHIENIDSSPISHLISFQIKNWFQIRVQRQKVSQGRVSKNVSGVLWELSLKKTFDNQLIDTVDPISRSSAPIK